MLPLRNASPPYNVTFWVGPNVKLAERPTDSGCGVSQTGVKYTRNTPLRGKSSVPPGQSVQFDGSLHPRAAATKRKTTTMWTARLGDAATVESMTTKLIKAVDAVVHEDVLRADYTEWDALLTASDDATAEFVANAKPAAASLVMLHALMRMDSAVVMARGPPYPFVFGTKKTNGLATAARFALENAALALYTTGVARRVCFAVAPRHGRLWDLMCMLDDLEGTVLEKDKEARYRTCVRVLGRAKARGRSSSLHSDCFRLVRLAYYDAFVLGSDVSADLKSKLLETCRTGVAGTSRVGQLVLKRIELEAQNVFETLDEQRLSDGDPVASAQDVATRMATAMRRLNCSSATLEFK